ncbi:MAG: TolC family protein [Burkholderiaceae bacterium]
MPTAPEIEPDLALDTPAEAVYLAWRRHPDLKRIQDVLGRQTTQQVAEGRLDALDSAWQRRVDEVGEWLDVATQARKAWIEAVAARQVVRFREAALTSAEASSELARRMVGVGNWSPLQAAPLDLATASARMDLRRAQLVATQAQMALMDLLGMGGSTAVLGLPSALPDLPASAMARSDWAGRLAAMQRQLPGMGGVRNRAASQAAFEVTAPATNSPRLPVATCCGCAAS